MRVLFMGSAPISCVSLEALLADADVNVVGVVTQPDRASGRKLQVRLGPVKALAESRGIPALAPERVNTPQAIAEIRAFAPDLIAVLAYGQILKRDLLEMAAYGCINVHTSLLPAYRGAAPIQWAVANGDSESGVTTMQMDAGMDTGDILMQTRVAIGPEDTAGDLHDTLAVAGAGLLVDTLQGLRAGTLTPRPQDAASATYAPKLKKSDGRIDWTLPAAAIHDRVRGFFPWPGCSCYLSGEAPLDQRVLKVHRARVVDATGEAGTVIDISAGGPTVAASQGAIQLLRVQPAGRKAMSGDEFLRGHTLQVGERMDA
ncbi:MAG: methionyl-tRNA formyltransferase [Kiritimatiellia bacterium]|jgi:methionyl-tRNA formyltransferase